MTPLSTPTIIATITNAVAPAAINIAPAIVAAATPTILLLLLLMQPLNTIKTNNNEEISYLSVCNCIYIRSNYFQRLYMIFIHMSM